MSPAIDEHAARSTIAILCYNQAHLIGGTVASALAQTVAADEILVVDDGSTDDSVAVLTAIPGIRVIEHGQNRGRTATRNSLLREATGDIIVYLDGDTVARPGLLAALMPEYTDPRVAAVGGQGIETCQESVYDRWRGEHAVQSWGPLRRTDIPWLYGLCCSFRRDVLTEVGGFYGHGEDMQIGYTLTARGYELRYVPDAQVEHQRHDDRASFENMMYRWWRGGYMVDRRWGRTAFRRMAVEMIADHSRHLIRYAAARDWDLARADLLAVLCKCRGMREGHRLHRRERSENIVRRQEG